MRGNENSGGPTTRLGQGTAAPQSSGTTRPRAKFPASRSRFAAPPQTPGPKQAFRPCRKLQNAKRSLLTSASQPAGRGQAGVSERFQDASEFIRRRRPGKMLIFRGQGDHEIGQDDHKKLQGDHGFGARGSQKTAR